MAITFPSKVITVLDVPEVLDFHASFRYNFFVADEKVNDRGDRRVQGASDDDEEKELAKRIPRWIDFSFSPVDTRTNAAVDNEFVARISRPQDVARLIRNNLSKIQNESDVAQKGYTALKLQDSSLDTKARRLVHHTLTTRARAKWPDEKSNRKLLKKMQTRSEQSKLLNEITSNHITSRWIMHAFGQMHQNSTYLQRRSFTFKWKGKSHTHSYNMRRPKPSMFHRFTKHGTYAQVNNKFIHTILTRSVADPMGPFGDEFSLQLEDTKQLQEEERKHNRPGIIGDYEYLPNIVPISVERVDPNKIGTAVKIVGYLVDKFEYSHYGRRYKKTSIIIPGATTGSGVDSKIKYGSKYAYSVRSIALVQFTAVDEETSQVYAVSGLLCSRPSPETIVTCKEFRAPPPPGDVNFVWDYEDECLVIMWSFPVVSQRDIKRFQLFRRGSIKEPFELQVEYDFDDSVIPDPRSEYPRRSRVKEMESPLTTYHDYEFTRDSIAIYSLCSIDAHDFSSNYSVQYVVWFDKVKNRLRKRLVSPSGAPKPYPNFYLVEGMIPGMQDVNLTSDCIKDSRHHSLQVFFDPEYLSIVNDDGEDLELLATKESKGSYKLQIINCDRQQSQVVDIEIEDLRSWK